MAMKRREMLAVLGGLGIAATLGVSPKAMADSTFGEPLEPTQTGLEPLFFEFLWPLIEPAAKAAITTLITDACTAIGRAFFNASSSSGSSASTGLATGNGRAVVTMSVNKHPAGHLLVHAHMLDTNGQRAFNHDGTAPSHTHPQMKDHATQIVGKAHAWLRGHGR
jgi:hypothetical protein